MPPNELRPYKANIFGLDKARRDCRFEMIKIVREVDAVAEDPKVACDPDRTWQYLSPSIFRMLLPVRAVVFRLFRHQVLIRFLARLSETSTKRGLHKKLQKKLSLRRKQLQRPRKH
ncbi:hypothetical protein K435DRAFT_653134 [Dendrothele bispora CBS 962.96]|uniref:Uncharacterized protein n=1 Tax=Dendrothele bispora (strain CBS 962.96) TaxID=1314807 RepID=A0A4S8MIY8_DENBC|nr:hypothetical protein K435DRAFT_653134 [Dendrothele bispora CBS 962.96]